MDNELIIQQEMISQIREIMRNWKRRPRFLTKVMTSDAMF